MEKFEIEIVERLVKVVNVEASNEDEARRSVIAQWHAEEIVLDSEDFVDVEINNI